MMYMLQKKEGYSLDFIPMEISSDFESMLMEGYFDGLWHDLHHLTFFVDNFAIYSVSYKETSDFFNYVDDDSREDTNKELIDIHFDDVMEDVITILNHYKLFHAWDDRGQNGSYEFDGVYLMPITPVW